MKNTRHFKKFDWNKKPRTISIVVDNPSWVMPYAVQLSDIINAQGDTAAICIDHDQVMNGCIAFYLGCTKIALPDILSRNNFNLVVHESDLPRGKGFSPVAWQILEGKSEIPVSLFEADNEVDAGNIYYTDSIIFEGHELNTEIRDQQGRKTVELCLRFVNEPAPPKSSFQKGESTYFRRRTPKDSEIDIGKTIEEQFNLLRVVDNERYPAFFEKDGYRYKLIIEKVDAPKNENKNK